MTGLRIAGALVVAGLLGVGPPDVPPLATDHMQSETPALSASAQQPPPGARGRRGRGPATEGLTARALERYFDDYEVLQAQRALGLDNEQFIVPGHRLRRLQNIRRRHENERRRLMNALRMAVGTPGTAVDEAGVATALQALNEAALRQARERRQAQRAFDAVLTIPQRARYRLFQERFERQKLDLLWQARQARRGGGS